MTRTGTSHFVSFKAACRYYAEYGYKTADVQQKLDEGEIKIGRPPESMLKPGQRFIVVDSYTRYAVEG